MPLALAAASALNPASAMVAGVVAGLGVAVPLGAVGLLLVQEGMRRGWRVGSGSAAGVATVDLVYAGLAAVAGAAVTHVLAGRERAVHVVAGAVLAAVAVRGLLGLRGEATSGLDVTPEAGTRRPALRGWARFVGITAVNPLTCLYFVALAAGLGPRLASASSRVAFVAGVGVGSLAWQLVLVAVGAGAGAVLGERGRRVTAVVGNVVVLALAVVVALG
ncbi:MAG: LysE family transporter [Kineosporiaceae bacterium]